jgi:MFS family permease
VLVGLTAVAGCIVLFGLATEPWQLDTARFAQGFASAFSWTGALAWLVAGTPLSRRGATIGNAFAAATGGALFGPVLGAVASQFGVRSTFVAVGVGSLGSRRARRRRRRGRRRRSHFPPSPRVRPHARAPRLLVRRPPALCFGTLGVLARCASRRLASARWRSAPFSRRSGRRDGQQRLIGRASDRYGTVLPLRIGLVASATRRYSSRGPSGASCSRSSSCSPRWRSGRSSRPADDASHAAEEVGLDYGYTFALVNVAWAPGQALGAAGSGALAHATSDALPYLLLSGVCALTLAALWRISPVSTRRSAAPSNMPSPPTTAGD